MSRARLAIVGGTVVDCIFRGVPRLPAWPDHTEFTPANLVTLPTPPLVTLGGNGANAAYVAARRGAVVTLHTTLASDALGGLARGWLEDAGCTLSLAPRAPATALNVTAADARLRRATFFHPGTPVALPSLSASPASRLPRAVLVCGWPHPPLGKIAREFSALRRRGVLTALDAGPLLDRPWTLAALAPVLAQLDLFLANDHELRRLARAGDLPVALRRLRRRLAGHVVVKRGAEGALWLPAGETEPQAQAARRVVAVNTVGAGDTFNGALLAALARGDAFARALREARDVAAAVVASPLGVLGAPARR